MASGSKTNEAAVDSVTMLDVLNEEKEIEDETAAVCYLCRTPYHYSNSFESSRFSAGPMRKTARTVR